MSVEPGYYQGIIADCIAWVDGAGTGFFITSELLLTCTHVVGKKTTVEIKPFGSSQTLQADVLPGALPVDAGDIALLRVKNPDPKQYAVLLHMLTPADFTVSRDVVLAGYPRDPQQKPGEYERVPVSVHPRLADQQTLAGIIVEGPADVAAGLSGSPALDVETGTVVGITRYRKGLQTMPGTGGGVIPIALAVAAFPQVRGAYDRPPEAARQWWSERGDDELRAIGRERRGTTGRFDLRLTGDLEEWSVHAQDENGPHSETIRLKALGVNVTRAVFQWTRGHRTPSGEDLQLVGQILAAALLHQRVGEMYRNWYETADELTIRLIADPACDLADLPWELAQAAGTGGGTLGLDTKLALARVMPGDKGPVAVPAAGDSATVTALIVQPDPKKLSYPSVMSAYNDEIAWPAADQLAKKLELAVTAPLELSKPIVINPSRTQLENLAGSCDILHYQGFAQVTPTATHLYFYSDNIARKLIPVDIKDVAAVAARLRAKVVVIEAHAAPASQYSRDDPALGIAREFLQAGVLAVLTTRYPIHPYQAIVFNQGFYKALGEGSPVERAAQAGRLSLNYENTMPDPAAYGAFVLWTADAPGLQVVRASGADGPAAAAWGKSPVATSSAKLAKGPR